jgi:hypothetical protein
MKIGREHFDYRDLEEKTFEKFCWLIAGKLSLNYGVGVEQAVLAKNITGDFNGKKIILRSDIPWEMKLFILLHLFGHTVQFNTSAALRKIGMKRWRPEEINGQSLKTIRAYERAAGRYGLWLLRDCGINYLDQWASDWSNGDLDYLVMLYTTGAKYELTGKFLRRYKKQYIKFGSPLIKPLRVPKFIPKKWPSRFSF